MLGYIVAHSSNLSFECSTKMKLFVAVSLLIFAAEIISGQPNCPNLDKPNVLILGGGIAGISAAKTLSDGGVTNFTIIEALSQIGGRVRTVELRPGSGISINAGANWIQGFDVNQRSKHPLWSIVNTPSCGGIEGFLSNLDSLVVRNSRGADISESPRLRYDDYEMALAAVETLSESLQSSGRPDISVRNALSRSGWNVSTAEDEWVDWFYFDFCYAEPPDDSSLFNAIPLPTYNDFGDDTGEYFISDNEGFFKVVRCLADEFLTGNDPRLRLNTIVRRIEWSDECVCVEVEENGATQRFCGQYAILTFSLGVLIDLQTAGVEFDPPLPQDLVNAVNQFRMAHYLNIVVEFQTRFWEDVEFIGFVNETNGRYFPLFTVLTHIQTANVLFCTVTKELADRIIRQTEEETKQEIIAVINSAYNLTLRTSDIVTLILPDWDINPLFLGSYSNVPLGVTDETYTVLHKPLGGRLFISGEVTSRNYSGFVHGGYLSGIDTANLVLTELQPSGGKGVLVQSINWCLLAAVALIGVCSVEQ